MTRLREDARHLLDHAAHHEKNLIDLLAACESDSPVTQRVLHAQRALRELCVMARQQHVALDRLVTDLGDRRSSTTTERARSQAVLVADDHAESRELLAVLLQNAGFVVRTAANGLEAVLVAHQLQPAVILMDLTMPVLGGVEAARLIKTLESLRAAHLIAYTAHFANQHPPADGLFAAVISKPSPPDQILATVQRYASQAARASAP